MGLYVNKHRSGYPPTSSTFCTRCACRRRRRSRSRSPLAPPPLLIVGSSTADFAAPSAAFAPACVTPPTAPPPLRTAPVLRDGVSHPQHRHLRHRRRQAWAARARWRPARAVGVVRCCPLTPSLPPLSTPAARTRIALADLDLPPPHPPPHLPRSSSCRYTWRIIMIYPIILIARGLSITIFYPALKLRGGERSPAATSAHSSAQLTVAVAAGPPGRSGDARGAAGRAGRRRRLGRVARGRHEGTRRRGRGARRRRRGARRRRPRCTTRRCRGSAGIGRTQRRACRQTAPRRLPPHPPPHPRPLPPLHALPQSSLTLAPGS